MHKSSYNKLKEYIVIVSKKNGETVSQLHKKGECFIVRGIKDNPDVQYHSFDSSDDARLAFPKLRYCQYCKSIQEIRKRENPNIPLWCIVFSLICAVIGYFVTNGSAFARVLCGIIFLVVGLIVFFIIAAIIERIVRKIKKGPTRKTISTILFALICIFMVYIACISFGVGGTPLDKSPYDDVWNKNPNSWTQSEKDYVNDFANAMWDN